jgi:hypothetical protein
LRQSPAERFDDFLFPSSHLVDVDFRLAEFDSPTAGQLVCFIDDFSHVKQGLGWYTTAKKAGPTELGFALDDYDFVSLVSREESCCISARTAT